MMIEDNSRFDSGATNSENSGAEHQEEIPARGEETGVKASPKATAKASASAKRTTPRREKSTTRKVATRVVNASEKTEKASADQLTFIPVANDATANDATANDATANDATANDAVREETPRSDMADHEQGQSEQAPERKLPERLAQERNSPEGKENRPEQNEFSQNGAPEEGTPNSSTRSGATRGETHAINNEIGQSQAPQEAAMPRTVRLPEVREERRNDVRSDARADNRGDRGLRFRGREGRAELRRNDARGFRTRFEGGTGNVGTGNNSNNANGNGNRNARNDNSQNTQPGRLQNNRNDNNRNDNNGNRNDNNRNDNNRNNGQNNRDEARDNRNSERNLERDLVRGQNDLDLTTLEDKNLIELHEIAKELNVDSAVGMQKSDLVLRILEAQAENSGNLFKKGILEILPDGKGFLRTEGYLSSNEDVYISQSQIKRFNLKTGDIVSGQVRAPKEMERYYGLLRVEACNGEAPDVTRVRKEFEKLTPIFPNEKFNLETTQENITARIIDLVSPIGKGQRGLIVAPPKAGKTSLIKNVANSIMANHPDVHLIVLLIDERPEEVTDIARSVRGEVVASTFDEMPENHIRVADMVLEKAKRMVEQKRDVVILLDSITRLSRASNLVVAPSGRTMSGGLDPAAMYKPKRLFGAARNIEEGGSLTILATVLVDTGSRMDEYIFEELKGTGNMDLVLDRNLFDQRIFPAIDINKSGTRRDDLLLTKDDLAATYHLRRTLSALDNDKAINLLIDRLRNTKTNADFMAIVQKSSRQQGAPAPTQPV